MLWMLSIEHLVTSSGMLCYAGTHNAVRILCDSFIKKKA